MKGITRMETDLKKERKKKEGKGEGPEGRREEIWRLKQKRGPGTTTRPRHKSQRLLEGEAYRGCGTQGSYLNRSARGGFDSLAAGGWIFCCRA